MASFITLSPTLPRQGGGSTEILRQICQHLIDKRLTSRQIEGTNPPLSPLWERAGERGKIRMPSIGRKMPDHRTAIVKALRRRMTDTERSLWRHLRAHRLASGKFKRQQPLGPYIVDFVCFRARLVIELDGGQHQDSDTDRSRDAWLEGQGFRVLRFWDNEVLTNLPAVLEKISGFLAPSPPPPSTELRTGLSREGRGDESM